MENISPVQTKKNTTQSYVETHSHVATPALITNPVAITSYFNPQRSETRLANYRRFSEELAKQGIPLYTAEGYCDKSELIGFNSVKSFQCRDILWQKERLLNLLLPDLPPEYDAVMWLDCDIYWDIKDLKNRVCDALSVYTVIQPWMKCRLLGQNGREMLWPGRNLIVSSAYHNRKQNKAFNPNSSHPGFAWAARRSVIEEIGGFYDAMITGAGDIVMCIGFCGDFNSRFIDASRMTTAMTNHWREWAEKAYNATHGKIGCIEADINHMYHGSLKDRQYSKRWKALASFSYNPLIDITWDKSQPLSWSDAASEDFRESVKRYIYNEPQSKQKTHVDMIAIPVPDNGISNQERGIITGASAIHWPCIGANVIAAHRQGLGFAIADHGLSAKQVNELKRVGVQFISHDRPVLPEKQFKKRFASDIKAWWKPWVCGSSPFTVTVWIDSDAVITGDIKELFDIAENGFCVSTQLLWQKDGEVLYKEALSKFFKEKFMEYLMVVCNINSGVFAWKKNDPVIDLWKKWCVNIINDDEVVVMCRVRDQSGLVAALIDMQASGIAVPTLLNSSWNTPADFFHAKCSSNRRRISLVPEELLKEATARHEGIKVTHWLGGIKPWKIK